MGALLGANKSVFLETFKQHSQNANVDSSALNSVAESHIETLTAIRSGHFSDEDCIEISKEAARRVAVLSTSESIQSAWQKVAEDFHSQKYWGFKTQTSKPQRPKKKKNELVGFIWIAIQAAIIMKVIVLYFGVNAAEQDSEGHYIALVVALTFSFAALFFFAWRKSKSYKD